MAKPDLSFSYPPALAIVEEGDTPDPGVVGVRAWSTTLGREVVWNGTAWVSTAHTIDIDGITPASIGAASAADLTAHEGLAEPAAHGGVSGGDPRLTDARVPLAHTHAPTEIVNTSSGAYVVGRTSTTASAPSLAIPLTSASTSSTVPIRDASGRMQVQGPSAASDVANKTYVDVTTLSTVATATFNLASSHITRVNILTSATAVTITIPPVASLSTAVWPIGSWAEFMQSNTGVLTFVAGAGVSIRTTSGLTMYARYGVMRLVRIGNDEWLLTQLDDDAVARITAHIDDTVDAHDASAISFAPTGPFSADQVQAAIAQVDTIFSRKAMSFLPFNGNFAPSGSPLTPYSGYCFASQDATPQSFTIPTEASASFAIGGVLHFYQAGGGALTIVAAGGVTLRRSTRQTDVLDGQYSWATAVKLSTDVWKLFGELTPA